MTTNAMLAQVYSLPEMIRESFQRFDDAARQTWSHQLCLSTKRVYITGCGDSHHAALGAELAFESLAGLPTEAQTALQFGRYSAGYLTQAAPGMNLVIGISVSGEVARTVEAMQRARARGASTLALTATPGSRVHQAGDTAFLTTVSDFPDLPGVHTPGIRSYAASQLGLYLSAIRLGEVRGHITTAEATGLRAELLSLAGAIEEVIQTCEPAVKSLAERWAAAREFIFVGSGPNFGTALFSAAKVLEASGDSAMGQDTEEWAHLQYFARDVDTPTIFITAGERDLSRVAEVIVAAQTIGRNIAVAAPSRAGELAEVGSRLPLPDRVREVFSPLVTAIPGEMFAAYRAEVAGEAYFRNFGGGRDQSGGGGISRIRTSTIEELAEG